jgi:hypothetical protein
MIWLKTSKKNHQNRLKNKCCQHKNKFGTVVPFVDIRWKTKRECIRGPSIQ